MANQSLDNIPVLLTSSVIAYDTSVSLIDTHQRIALGLASVKEWLRLRPNAPIVLCDGSRHDFSQAVRSMFANKPIECLHFQNDQSIVARLGRGWGEGEIVKYALSHSQLIREASAFVKCTSKLWVENFEACASLWNNKLLCRGIFLNAFEPWKELLLHHIDTRFYICTTDFYAKHFLEVHQHILNAQGLEECFKLAIEANGLEMQGVLFAHSPEIYGVGGGIGSNYQLPMHRRLKERLRLAIAKRSSTYGHLFASCL